MLTTLTVVALLQLLLIISEHYLKRTLLQQIQLFFLAVDYDKFLCGNIASRLIFGLEAVSINNCLVTYNKLLHIANLLLSARYLRDVLIS